MFVLVAVFVFGVTAASLRAAPDGADAAEAFPGRNGAIVFYHVRSVAAQRNGEWGNLYTIDETGQSLRLIVRRAGHAAWSPDGRRLAVNDCCFLSEADMVVLPGAPNIVRTPAFSPSWAPDGRRLVGMELEGLAVVIIRVGAARGETIYTDEGIGWPTYNSPAWSPRGRLIALSSEMGGAFYDVLRRSFVPRRGFAGQHPAWSPDGARLAFDTSDPFGRPTAASAVVVSRADGTQRRVIARNASDPAWSPDGRKIAFVRFVSRTNTEIFVMNVDGTHQRRLTRLPGPDGEPDRQPLRRS